MELHAGGCFYCGDENAELRPYGPGGANVCAPCVMGTDAPPERRAQAERQFAAALASAGPVAVLGAHGPRAATVADVATLNVNRRARRAARRMGRR